MVIKKPSKSPALSNKMLPVLYIIKHSVRTEWQGIQCNESTTKMLPQYSVKCKHNVLKITLILQQSLSLGTLQKTAALVVCK